MEEYSRNKTISSTGRRLQNKYFELDSLEENHQDEESNFVIENNIDNNKIIEEKDKLLQELREKLQKEKDEKFKVQIECMKLKKIQEENSLKTNLKNAKNFLEKSEIIDKWIKFAKNDIMENFVDFSPLQIYHLISDLFILCSELLEILLKEKYIIILNSLNIPESNSQMKNISQDLKNIIIDNIENVIFYKEENDKFFENFKIKYSNKCLIYIKNKEEEFFDLINSNSFKSMLDNVKNIILFAMFNEPNLHFEIEKDYLKREIIEIPINNNRENYIIVNDPGIKNFSSIILLNPPVTSSKNEISILSDLKKILIKYDKNDTIDDLDFTQSNINNETKDSSNFKNIIIKHNSLSSLEVIKNNDIEEIPKYETNTGTKFEMLKYQNKKKENDLLNNKSDYIYENVKNPITFRLENKMKKNNQNKSKLSKEHEHLQTEIKEFTNDNIFLETPNDINNTNNYKKNIMKNKYEYEKISSNNKNMIFNQKIKDTYNIYNNKRILTKKNSAMNTNIKREKLISGKKISSNHPKKFITKKPKDSKIINNKNPGSTRQNQTTKKFFNSNENDINYASETVLSSPGKDSSFLKTFKNQLNTNSNHYRIDSENSINQKTECHIQNVNINLININQNNRVINKNPKKDLVNNNNNYNFFPPQYFDLNEVDEVSKCVKDGLSKNKTLIIKVKKGKNFPNQKEIMISTNINQNDDDNLTDASNQYHFDSQDNINLFNSKNKHSLLKLKKGKVVDNIRMESPSAFCKRKLFN